MRIVATAIIVLSGAICVAASVIPSHGPATNNASVAGTFLLVIGGAAFVVEYFRGWKVPPQP